MNARFGCCLIATALLLTAAQPAVTQDEKKGLRELQGMWKLVRFEVDGEESEFPANLPRWVVKDDKVLYGGDVLAVLTADAATKPRSVDLDFKKAKRVDEGIFAIEGDKLKICVNQPKDGVKERPLDFATEGKAGRRLLVFQREKAGADDGTAGGPGFVGVQIGYHPDTKQVIVVNTLEASPARKAGLKKDDAILKVGGEPVTDLKSVIRLVQQAKSGSKLTITIERGEKERDVAVRVGVLPFFLLD
jgi:uncharacterized protein (TIGR03067 family)